MHPTKAQPTRRYPQPTRVGSMGRRSWYVLCCSTWQDSVTRQCDKTVPYWGNSSTNLGRRLNLGFRYLLTSTSLLLILILSVDWYVSGRCGPRFRSVWFCSRGGCLLARIVMDCLVGKRGIEWQKNRLYWPHCQTHEMCAYILTYTPKDLYFSKSEELTIRILWGFRVRLYSKRYKCIYPNNCDMLPRTASSCSIAPG